MNGSSICRFMAILTLSFFCFRYMLYGEVLEKKTVLLYILLFALVWAVLAVSHAKEKWRKE